MPQGESTRTLRYRRKIRLRTLFLFVGLNGHKLRQPRKECSRRSEWPSMTTDCTAQPAPERRFFSAYGKQAASNTSWVSMEMEWKRIHVETVLRVSMALMWCSARAKPCGQLTMHSKKFPTELESSRPILNSSGRIGAYLASKYTKIQYIFGIMRNSSPIKLLGTNMNWVWIQRREEVRPISNPFGHIRNLAEFNGGVHTETHTYI